MAPSTYKSGDLCVENDGKGNIRITRQSNMQAIELSPTEWAWLAKVSELFGWPCVPNADVGGQAQ